MPRYVEPSTKEGVAPKGWEGPILKMKKHGVKNPWALSWSMKKKGYKPGGKRHQMDAAIGDADDERVIEAANAEFDVLEATGMVPHIYLAAAKGELWAISELMK